MALGSTKMKLSALFTSSSKTSFILHCPGVINGDFCRKSCKRFQRLASRRLSINECRLDTQAIDSSFFSCPDTIMWLLAVSILNYMFIKPVPWPCLSVKRLCYLHTICLIYISFKPRSKSLSPFYIKITQLLEVKSWLRQAHVCLLRQLQARRRC